MDKIFILELSEMDNNTAILMTVKIASKEKIVALMSQALEQALISREKSAIGTLEIIMSVAATIQKKLDAMGLEGVTTDKNYQHNKNNKHG